MNGDAADEGKKQYLIFERGTHSVIYFVRAETTTDAIWSFIAEQNDDASLQADGSLIEDGVRYDHPLAYIEARYKTVDEWQIREMPDWAWEDDFAEMFCGESADGPQSVIEECRGHFAHDYPKARARAFLWYLKEGALVTLTARRGSRFRSSGAIGGTGTGTN